MPCTEPSLIITASSVASQPEFGDVKSECLWKRLIKSSSRAALCKGSANSVRLLGVKVMVSITSFSATSCDLGISDGFFFSFFFKVFFLPILLRMHFIILRVNELSSPGGLVWVPEMIW